ncbi:hypothetical protein CDAR_572171 [Caerostris darwini]|uniref:Uncharacterized protein n=1 Tax=Caerostris darwini TaxID=1538125 RepID=A0AAV4MT08_9ARAC|nr:hypothetical protein CDAR_572171 [Caerostris darwini]
MAIGNNYGNKSNSNLALTTHQNVKFRLRLITQVRDSPWSSFPHTVTNGTSAVPSREEPGSHQGALMEMWHCFRRGVKVGESSVPLP